MIYLSPSERRQRRARRLRCSLIILAGLVLFLLLDFPLLHLFYTHPDAHIEGHDWYRLLRIIGYFGTWIIIGIAMVLHDRNRHRGLALVLSSGLAGLVAELLKLVIARERPVENGIIQPGLYHFRGFFSGFSDGSNLGMPSSHTAVAFGGCLMLACYFPRCRSLMILLALGCGITRMLTGAHFASDVYVGAVLGWGMAALMCRIAQGYVPELAPRYRSMR